MTEDSDRPVNSGWFRKGQSGNPGGRPRRIRSQPSPAFDIVIGKTVTVSRGGVSREVSVEEALQHRTYQEALGGKRMAIREVLRWIAKREKWLARNRPTATPTVTRKVIRIDPRNADDALILLGIACENASRRDVKADRKQLLLEPWAVKLALKRRRGAERLTKKDVEDVRRRTRDDGTVKFPMGVER